MATGWTASSGDGLVGAGRALLGGAAEVIEKPSKRKRVIRGSRDFPVLPSGYARLRHLHAAGDLGLAQAELLPQGGDDLLGIHEPKLYDHA